MTMKAIMREALSEPSTNVMSAASQNHTLCFSWSDKYLLLRECLNDLFGAQCVRVQTNRFLAISDDPVTMQSTVRAVLSGFYCQERRQGSPG